MKEAGQAQIFIVTAINSCHDLGRSRFKVEHRFEEKLLLIVLFLRGGWFLNQG